MKSERIRVKRLVSVITPVILLLAAWRPGTVLAQCQHGASIFKTCESPKRSCVTDADCPDTDCTEGVCDLSIDNHTNCKITLTHADTCGDTTKIIEGFDVQDDGGDNVRVPAVGSLPLGTVSGNAVCCVGPVLPCFVGPAGSLFVVPNSSTGCGNLPLPGAAQPGSVSFTQNTYVVQPTDPDPLPDKGNVTGQDLCNAGAPGCSTTIVTVQFGASTDIADDRGCLADPKPDSTPCPDTDPADCITAGCNGVGSCDQAHIDVPDSTPCPDTDLDPCTTSGCNGMGTCDQSHIVCTTTTTTTTTTSTTTTTAPPGCGDGTVDPGEQCDPPGPNSPQCPTSPAGAFLRCQANCTCCIPQPEICGNLTDDDCDGLIDCLDPDCVGSAPCIRRDPSRIVFHVPPVGLDQFTSHGKVIGPQGLDVAHMEVGFVLSNGRGVLYRGVLHPGDLWSRANKRYLRYRDNAARLGQGQRDGIFRAKIQIGARGKISYHVKSYTNLSAATDADMAIHFYVGSGAQTHAWGTSGKWKRTTRGWVAGKAQLVAF